MYCLLKSLILFLSLSRLNIAHSPVNNFDIILNIIAYIITLFSGINLRLPAHYYEIEFTFKLYVNELSKHTPTPHTYNLYSKYLRSSLNFPSPLTSRNYRCRIVLLFMISKATENRRHAELIRKY